MEKRTSSRLNSSFALLIEAGDSVVGEPTSNAGRLKCRISGSETCDKSTNLFDGIASCLMRMRRQDSLIARHLQSLQSHTYSGLEFRSRSETVEHCLAQSFDLLLDRLAIIFNLFGADVTARCEHEIV